MLKYLSFFVPGGQIGLILSSIWNAIVTVVRWLVEDVVDVLTKPRLALLVVVGIACGGYWAADFYRDRLQDLELEVKNTNKQLATANQERSEWKERYDTEVALAAKATAAKKAAEDKVRVDVEAAAASAHALAAKRLRDRAGAAVASKTAPQKAPEPSVFSGWPFKL